MSLVLVGTPTVSPSFPFSSSPLTPLFYFTCTLPSLQLFGGYISFLTQPFTLPLAKASTCPSPLAADASPILFPPEFFSPPSIAEA